MSKKEIRIGLFNDLQKRFDKNIRPSYHINKKAALISIDHDFPTIISNQKAKSISVTNESVVATAKRIKRPLILVFGSAHKPGGGVISGAVAQEEDIALTSTWYFQVKDNKDYYQLPQNNLMYSEKILYLSNSLLLSDEYYQKIYPQKVSFIGCAAPNLSGMKDSGIEIHEARIYEVLERRIAAILNFAEYHGHKDLILGAWGCGVFGLSPEKVSLIFKKVISENHFSGNLYFPVLDKEMFTIFEKNLVKNPSS